MGTHGVQCLRAEPCTEKAQSRQEKRPCGCTWSRLRGTGVQACLRQERGQGAFARGTKKNPYNCNVAGSLLSLRQSTYSAWCRGRDLNPHGIATAPSRQRVYQFHHLDNEKNVYSALRKKASKKCEFLKNIFLAGNPEWLETGWRTVPCALCLPLWAGSRGDRAPIPARSSECPRPGDS